MLHDEEVFPNPEEFDPERFIKDGILRKDIIDPEAIATFGFGRRCVLNILSMNHMLLNFPSMFYYRICPGSHIALANLYIAAASIMYLFDLSPPLDAEGNPVEVTPYFSSDSIGS
jgi:cytochrome P450